MAPQIDQAEIEHRFRPHVPTDDGSALIEHTRAEFERLAETLARTLPEGREKSLAITALEESSFWAIAGIARS